MLTGTTYRMLTVTMYFMLTGTTYRMLTGTTCYTHPIAVSLHAPHCVEPTCPLPPHHQAVSLPPR